MHEIKHILARSPRTLRDELAGAAAFIVLLIAGLYFPGLA